MTVRLTFTQTDIAERAGKAWILSDSEGRRYEVTIQPGNAADGAVFVDVGVETQVTSWKPLIPAVGPVSISKSAVEALPQNAWRVATDDDILHVWENADGQQVTVPPSFYADAGTPVDSETGEDLEYVQTLIRL